MKGMESDLGVVGYRKLVVWQKAHELVLSIYKSTRLLPKEELHGIINQIRRATVSVPANITEGYARSSRKEFIQFLYIAYASLSEVEYYIQLIRDLGYLSAEECISLESKRRIVGKMLYKLILSLKIKKSST